MNKIATIPYNEVKFRWVSSHWDIHLNGTCVYNNELHEFKTVYPDDEEQWDKLTSDIYKLTTIEKIKWLWTQWLFELCVGDHWSYDKTDDRHSGFYYRRPEWLYKILSNLYYWKQTKKHKKSVKESKERDWPEDSNQENGNYMNQCVFCKKDFIGNKHRVICKKCSAEKKLTII